VTAAVSPAAGTAVSAEGHLLWRWWDRFWFAPGSARNLAGARIVFGMHALWILLSRDLAALSGLPPAYWAQVPGSARLRYLLFPGHAPLEHFLQALALGALVAVVLGLAPRVSCLLAGLLLYHLAPLETIIWTPSPYERGFEVTVLALLVLAFAPCADAWSLRRPSRPAAPSWEYHWPLVLTQIFVAQIYFFSGYSKLFRVGWSWLTAENLRSWLLVFNQQDQIAVFQSVGPWVAAHPSLCLAVALSAVALDLGFILAVFSSRLRLVLVPLAALFHLGILVSMNIAFLNAPQLLVFIDWDALARRFRAARSGS
jgi:hypothetical protein